MEKPAVKDQDAVFIYSFTYTARAQYHHIDAIKDVLPYDTLASPEWKEYTKQESLHHHYRSCRGTGRKSVGDETNPFLRLQKIFTYISFVRIPGLEPGNTHYRKHPALCP